MVREARMLTATYSDGVGIYAFQANSTRSTYAAAPISRGVDQRVTSLDNVLDFIAAEIQQIMAHHNNEVPPPVTSKALELP